MVYDSVAEAALFDPAILHETAPLIDGRIGCAIDELLRLLETYLPPWIDYLNTTLNLQGSQQIRKPTRYLEAEQTLDGKAIDLILVEVNCPPENTAVTSPESFKDNWHVQIHSIDKRIESQGQVKVNHDRGGAITIMLSPVSGQWFDPQGRETWNQLVPIGKTGLPEKYKDFKGFTLHLLLVQAPETNNWI